MPPNMEGEKEEYSIQPAQKVMLLAIWLKLKLRDGTEQNRNANRKVISHEMHRESVTVFPIPKRALLDP